MGKGYKDRGVRPVPVLSLVGEFAPAGSLLSSGGFLVRPDAISVSVEGAVVIRSDRLLYPVSPGDHHKKSSGGDVDWDDIL